MQSLSKVVDRKKDLRTAMHSDEIKEAIKSRKDTVTEIDLSFNDIE